MKRSSKNSSLPAEVKISLKCNKGVPCCECELQLCTLGVFEYYTCTIFLGCAYINEDDVEDHVEDTINHEMVHFVLYKLFDETTSRSYDYVYHLAEPKGQVIVIG